MLYIYIYLCVRDCHQISSTLWFDKKIKKNGNRHHHRALCSWKGPPKQARRFKWSNFWRSCAQHEVAKVNVLRTELIKLISNDIDMSMESSTTRSYVVHYKAAKYIEMPLHVCVCPFEVNECERIETVQNTRPLTSGNFWERPKKLESEKTHSKTQAWLSKKVFTLVLHPHMTCPSKAKASSPADFEWKGQMDPPIAALQLWWPLDATCLSSDQSLPCKFW